MQISYWPDINYTESTYAKVKQMAYLENEIVDYIEYIRSAVRTQTTETNFHGI